MDKLFELDKSFSVDVCHLCRVGRREIYDFRSASVGRLREHSPWLGRDRHDEFTSLIWSDNSANVASLETGLEQTVRICQHDENKKAKAYGYLCGKITVQFACCAFIVAYLGYITSTCISQRIWRAVAARETAKLVWWHELFSCSFPKISRQ